MDRYLFLLESVIYLMKNIEILSSEDITREILKDYNSYNNLFVNTQSFFLSLMYKRYKSLVRGNVVLFFSKENQKSIMRLKDYDFFHDISLIKFWENICNKKNHGHLEIFRQK